MSSSIDQLAHRLISADFALAERSGREVFVYEKKAAEGNTRVVIMGQINSIYIYEWYKDENNELVSQTDVHNIDQARQVERIYNMLSI
jgi:hypothetical protein